MSQNPFIVGQPVPPDRFVGRSSEIEAAFDQILSRSNVAFWGGPGIGKTSVLQLLASPQVWQLHGYDPSLAVIVLLSCLSVSPFSGSGFWREVLSILRDELLNLPDVQTEIDKLLEADKATKDNLRKILRQLGKQNKFLVLLIDDYDAALCSNLNHSEQDIITFLGDCRHLAYHCKERQYLSVVVTSQRRLNELGPKLKPDGSGSPWYNHYLFLPLKPLTNAEIFSLLNWMPMTPSLRDGIREIAGGHPALLQNGGHLLYRELRLGKLPDLDAFARDFRTATEHFLEDTWNMANDTEQTLMMLITLVNLRGRLTKKRYDLGNIEILFSQKERELSDLVERGVLINQGEVGKPTYTFTSSLMEWWVVKEIENSDETWLQQRQRTFLNLMSQQQATHVTEAIRWLWQHKDTIPSFLEWLGKVSAALPKGAIQG